MENKIPKSMIIGVQSVVPMDVTHHRNVRSIAVVDPVGVGIFRRTLNIVTYNKQGGDDESGWLVAGLIKESLGRALKEQPMISGRLRRRKTVDNGLEVVTNDSGARLMEARFPASFKEFLEMVKIDKNRAEAEIVFWRDIDEDNPHFSPLFYVQVTNFENGGGYTIGISCSIVIADLILKTDFLTKWSQIQSSLVRARTTLKPIFHLPSHKQNLDNYLAEFSSSGYVLDRGETVVFRAKTSPRISIACMKKPVVALEKECVDVFLFLKEQNNDEYTPGCDSTKVEIHSRDGEIGDCDLEETDCEVFDKNLAFGERFEVMSCWIGSVSKGVVFVISSTFGDKKPVAKFIVALPKE